MAFPLTFRDERGKFTRYRWEGYPMVVVRGPTVEFGWDDEPFEATMMEPVRITVFCGPAAPLPAMPTADTFAEGVWGWLYR
jgi:hypothetical protein